MLKLNESYFSILSLVPDGGGAYLESGEMIRVERDPDGYLQVDFELQNEMPDKPFYHSEQVLFRPDGMEVLVVTEEIGDLSRNTMGPDHAIFTPESSRFDALLGELVDAQDFPVIEE